MFRKGLAVAVILLFIGVALAPTINATQEPIPDLVCKGDINWDDVAPGETVTGSFTVSNVGDSGSLLDWEVVEWPKWGEWTFTPPGGNDLSSGTVLTVVVTIVAPDDPWTSFDGEITVENLENSSDFCTVDIVLVVAFAQSINANDKEINDDTTEPLDVGRTIIRGFGLFPIFWEDNVTFFAIRLHLIIITDTTRTVGTYWFQWITLPLNGFFYSPGRLDIIMFYIATIKGDFEPQ